LSTLAIEFTASRMLQTVYGTSNLIWANVIGLVLLALSLGYALGGRLADRRPEQKVFYTLVSISGFTSIVFLLLMSMTLREAAAALATVNVSALAGSLVITVLALIVPVTLLGCVSPFAVRLAVSDVAVAGRISGRIYALSTLGSLLGTYLPVLLVIPLAGSRAAALLFGGLLLAVGLAGLWLTGGRGREVAGLTVTLPLLVLPVAALALGGGVKATPGQVFEAESTYNYIEVLRRQDCNYLLLNEGQAYHSFYCDGGRVPAISVWSIMLAAPAFARMEAPRRAAVIGLAAGTIPKQLTQAFGPIPIDGIELDPAIIQVGRDYFDLDEPNIRAIAGDGRYEFNRLAGPYDLVTLDAYKVPYIPWHLTTREFFTEVREKLSTEGVLAVNVGRAPGDRRLVEAISATLLEVFPSVHAVDVPGSLNTILFATVEPGQGEAVRRAASALPEDADPLLRAAVDTAAANLVPVSGAGPVFTDDRAPVEPMADAIVLRYLLQTGPSGLPGLGQ
jgi:spermidine synthase